MPSVPDMPANPAAVPGERSASAGGDTRSAAGDAQIWVSPGVGPRKRLLTGLGIALAAAVFILIAVYQGGPIWVSTLIGIVFIGCFVWYLRIVAPTPYTLALDGAGMTRQERGGEPVTIPWTGLARVKEEAFANGTPISLAVYKRVGERGVHRAFVVYRDDIPRFDTFLATVRAALPEGVPYQRETVHE